MNREEFLAALDANNPFHPALCICIRSCKSERLIAYRKGPDLCERVEEIRKYNLFPLVDKTTNMVIGMVAGDHQYVIGMMYTFHVKAANPDFRMVDPGVMTYWYLSKGMGYYFTSQSSNTIIVETAYVPDEWDSALFQKYRLSLL